MKNYILTAICLLAGLVNGQSKQSYPVSGFQELHVSSAIEVIVTLGDTEGVVIEAEESDQKKVKVDVRSGVLHLSMNDRSETKKTIKAYVSMKSLTGIDANGASSVKVTDAVKSEKFSMDVDGASSVNIELNALELDAEIEGAGTIRIKGGAKKLMLSLTGASDFKGASFEVNTANIKASGASSATVIARQSLTVNASGASSVTYGGEPTEKIIEARGASSVKKA